MSQEQIIDIKILRHKFKMSFMSYFPMHRLIYYYLMNRKELYEKEVTLKICELLKIGDTFVDVGAHIGWFTLLAASIVGKSGRVLAVEPDMTNFKYLQRQVKINELDGNVRLRKYAVTSETGDVTLFFNSDNDGGHSLWPTWRHKDNKISMKQRKSSTVEGITLDELCEKEGISYINILKVDTEGAEVKVFKGAKKLLSNQCIAYIVAEALEFGLNQMGSNVLEMVEMMEDYGYQAYQLDDHGFEYNFNLLFCRKDLDANPGS